MKTSSIELVHGLFDCILIFHETNELRKSIVERQFTELTHSIFNFLKIVIELELISSCEEKLDKRFAELRLKHFFDEFLEFDSG